MLPQAPILKDSIFLFLEITYDQRRGGVEGSGVATQDGRVQGTDKRIF